MSVLVGGIPGNSSRLGGGLAGTGPEMMSDVTPQNIMASRGISQVAPRGWFRRTLTGIAKDETGTPMVGAMVHVIRTSNDVIIDQQLSDATGTYVLAVYDDGPFYLVAYKAGSPDKAGASVNTLIGV